VASDDAGVDEAVRNRAWSVLAGVKF
jgi:hypothetical protein